VVIVVERKQNACGIRARLSRLQTKDKRRQSLIAWSFDFIAQAKGFDC
jgi:hypothetical protein